MDLVMLALGAIVVSGGIIGWDLSSRRMATEPPSEGRQNLAELAHYVFFFAALGLLLKFMSFAAVLLTATLVTGGVWGAWALAGRARARAEPMAVELARGLFPIIAIVFLLRSFLAEPFKIPSGSMIPSLLIGDFILVNKYAFGVRLPVLNKKVIEVGDPQRGDVMVFRYPEDTSIDYIKRVVGLPGDRIEYRNKRLVINGKLLEISPAGSYTLLESKLRAVNHEAYTENLGELAHAVIINPDAPAMPLAAVRQFPLKENCAYNELGFACTVPAGHYFMMGDNRDGSSDSRFWGFVPEQNIVGKAFLVWWNFGELSRIGTRIR